MPNSLGSSCTADVQGIDWKMTLAGFVFLFLNFFSFPPLLFPFQCLQWVWRHLAPSHMSLPGVVGAVFSPCCQEPGFQQGMCGTGSCSSCCHHPWAALGAVSGKGKPGEGGMLVRRGSCFSGCACSNPALFPFNFTAKTVLVMGKAWCRILVCSLVRMAKLLESVERKSVL